jgi:UDP-2,4-diacetamido-2,4,6-trideoxy-beta-L-altropyranose hydrolase
MKRAYVRVDGSLSIGLGHLVRCMALAHIIKHYCMVTFVCKDIPDALKLEISESSFDLLIIEEEEAFLELITATDMVVLDGYNFDSDYQRRIKSKGVKLICIDDLHDKKYYADLIINPAPGIDSNSYDAEPATDFALGPCFALLRPAFLQQAKKNRVIDKVRTVFICFGGGDYKNLTARVLKGIMNFRGGVKKVIVVTGSAYSNLDTLKSLIKDEQRIQHFHSVTEQEMLALMLEADLAIVPSSGILFEVLSTGMKVISGYYADNQINIYKGFLALNAIIDAGDFSEDGLSHALQDVNRHTLTKIIDGSSADNLLAKIKVLLR